ncbi:hypothetical protein CLAFUW4_13728 [Fulvia fulva]|uniref:Uncharacterized protein n=1 Tax=Passalora fulva TaxID=5499 RepID=A0A9Q8PKZ4_PASFU|nr:uncharacterized protein CLAFUR5_13576 [Fulvia fulva]KAK4610443.1 hypothetical protein CLAFUR4_13731 [Fulvia fulva]KAK4611031.1 hypothetical protein CLAFUR0_13735 [Fulvia fulva]UJO24441.1 hypothetical protein CLAFUR5_13576 [Fulvia fulva]WPV21785.1 hypothetical protein CLAFUW4_13728 [Fulvia fulva]WPV36845.1 hypothetical protein CLAFUW7_13736 [Fulvia fulva]
MGARLSQPRGPGGTTESSLATSPSAQKRGPRFNSRMIAAPAAAFTMACILFVYARTSIRAAKANAQRHRDADTGGEGVSLLNEHRRRHGQAPKLEEGTMKELGRQLVRGEKRDPKTEAVERSISEEEERLKALKGRRGGRGAPDA